MSKAVLFLLLMTWPGIGQVSIEKELLAMENQFFSAWKAKSLDAIQNNVAADGISWSEWGTFDKAGQLANQKPANANCTVKSWDLKDVRVLNVSADSAMLIYTLNQEAGCGGGNAPSPVLNSSLWVRRSGRWINVYRASALPKR